MRTTNWFGAFDFFVHLIIRKVKSPKRETDAKKERNPKMVTATRPLRSDEGNGERVSDLRSKCGGNWNVDNWFHFWLGNCSVVMLPAENMNDYESLFDVDSYVFVESHISTLRENEGFHQVRTSGKIEKQEKNWLVRLRKKIRLGIKRPGKERR